MKKRHWIILLVIGLISFPFIKFGGGSLAPVLPIVQLPGEVVWRGTGWLQDIFGGWTNTFNATVLTWILLGLFAMSLKAKSRTADQIPTGWYNFWEMVIEGSYTYVESLAGKWARQFFPFFMTFILLILFANWMELVPGVDSIGKWESMGELAEHKAHAADTGDHGTEDAHATEEDDHGSADSDDHAVTTDDGHGEEMADGEHGPIYVAAMEANKGDLRRGIFLIRAGEDDHGKTPADADWTIVPYIRAAATDLNFTLALAIVSVFMTQYYGMKALGIGYWKKFFPFLYPGFGDKVAANPLGLMDAFVGILEFVAEVAKILSFSFRLLGNIFAGQVLLFVMAFLLPVANIAFFGLEFFVGLIQAAVFALLTLTFMSGATHDHHAEEH